MPRTPDYEIERPSPEFNRDVATAAGEHGGRIERMTFPKDIRHDSIESLKGPRRLHWDASQLPHAIEWLVTFGGGSAAGCRCVEVFSKRRES
jgi:hypothetical protein